MTRSTHHLALVVLAPIGSLGVFLSAAWIAGLVDADRSPVDADYLWHPADISDGMRLALGLTATVLAVGIVLLVARWSGDGAISHSAVIVLIALGAIAAYGGVTYAVATAPVIGANIGGGLMVIAAGPFAVVAIALAVLALIQEHKQRNVSPD